MAGRTLSRSPLPRATEGMAARTRTASRSPLPRAPEGMATRTLSRSPLPRAPEGMAARTLSRSPLPRAPRHSLGIRDDRRGPARPAARAGKEAGKEGAAPPAAGDKAGAAAQPRFGRPQRLQSSGSSSSSTATSSQHQARQKQKAQSRRRRSRSRSRSGAKSQATGEGAEEGDSTLPPLPRWDEERRNTSLLLLQLLFKDPELQRLEWPAKVLANATQAAFQLESLPPPPPPPGRCKSSLQRRLEAEAHTAMMRELLTSGGLSSLELLLDCVGECLQKFHGLHAVTALVWIARICSMHANDPEPQSNLCNDARFLGLCERLRELAPDMSGGMMSSVVWSMAKLGFRDETLLTIVADKAASNMAIFHPNHLMRVCWGFARIHFRHKKLMEKLPGAALAGSWNLPAVDLCHILWAFVEFGLVQTGAQANTFCKILERLLHLLHQGQVKQAQQAEETPCSIVPASASCLHPSDLVQLVVAMTRCSESQHLSLDPLLAATNTFAHQHRGSLGPADLCGLLFAFAKSHHWQEAAELLESCAVSFCKFLPEVSSDTFASAVWALGALHCEGHVDLRVLTTIAGPAILQHAALSLAQLQSPEQVVGLIWGLVSAGLDDGMDVLKYSAPPLQKLLGGDVFSPQELCCLLWSFAAQGLRHRPVYLALADSLAGSVDKASWSDLADCLWALAASNVHHGPLSLAAGQRAAAGEGLEELVGVPDRLRIAWGLTALLEDLGLRAQAVQALLPADVLSGCFSAEAVEAHPAWVWDLLQQVLLLQEQPPEVEWLELCAQHVAKGWRSEAAVQLRREVNALLAEGGSVKEEEPESVPDGALRAGSAQLAVDVMLPLRKLALDAESRAFTVFDLEADRPVPNGVAQLRRRCLAREGWILCLVPQSVFNSAHGRPALQELLRAHPR